MTATYASLLAGDTSAGVFGWRGDPGRDLAAEAVAAGWQVRVVDSRRAVDAAGLYDAIATDWALPDGFGRNLDALWDVLGDLAVEPLVVVWVGCSPLAAADPGLAQSVLELLRDASTQAEALATVVVDPPGPEALGISGLDGLL